MPLDTFRLCGLRTPSTRLSTIAQLCGASPPELALHRIPTPTPPETRFPRQIALRELEIWMPVPIRLPAAVQCPVPSVTRLWATIESLQPAR